MHTEEHCLAAYDLHISGILPLTEGVSRVFSGSRDYLLIRGEQPGFLYRLQLQEKALKTQALQTLDGQPFAAAEGQLFALFPVEFQKQCLAREDIDPRALLSLLQDLQTDVTREGADLPTPRILPKVMEEAFSGMLDFAHTSARESRRSLSFGRYLKEALTTASAARMLLDRADWQGCMERSKSGVSLHDLRPENFFLTPEDRLAPISCFSAAPGLLADDVAKLIANYAPQEETSCCELLQAAALTRSELLCVFANLLFPWDFWSAGYRSLALDEGDAGPAAALQQKVLWVKNLMARLCPEESFPQLSEEVYLLETEDASVSVSVPAAAADFSPSPEAVSPAPPATVSTPQAPPPVPDFSGPLTWTFPKGR